MPAIIGHLVIMLTVSTAVLLLFRRQITAPVGRLVLDLKGQQSNDLDIPVKLARSLEYPDELFELAQAINLLRSNLHSYLKERDLLVGEIHHRIKNDMGFITALLSLQAEQSGSPEVKQAIHEASQRISVMARIYEWLYRDDNFLEVAIKPLVEQLVGDLQHLSALSPGSISLAVAGLSVPTRLSVNIGIILNELLTNAIKYCRPAPGQLRVDIDIGWGASHESIEVRVVDNGPGMPEDVLNGSRRGYGLTIVHALVQQHHGTMVLKNDNGSVVVISIPVS
jgi:two-component sensor histidine kinase